MAYRETFSTWNVYPVAEKPETAHSKLGEEKRRWQHGEAQLTITCSWVSAPFRVGKTDGDPCSEDMLLPDSHIEEAFK